MESEEWVVHRIIAEAEHPDEVEARRIADELSKRGFRVRVHKLICEM